MSWLDKYFRSGVKNIAIGGVLLPPETTLNFASGASGVDNPASGSTDVTVSGSGGLYLTAPAVGPSTTGIVSGTRYFANCAAGICAFNPPALTPGTPQTFSISDVEASTFGTRYYATLANASSNIEDPNSPGTYNTNPIKLQSPDQVATWVSDSSGTYWKAT